MLAHGRRAEVLAMVGHAVDDLDVVRAGIAAVVPVFFSGAGGGDIGSGNVARTWPASSYKTAHRPSVGRAAKPAISSPRGRL